jgi:hypothetical protein
MSHASDPATPSSQQALRCPACQAALAPGAVLCVTCGYHLAQGKRLQTSVESAGEPLEAGPDVADDGNPYRSPAQVSRTSPDYAQRNYDPETRIAWLEDRVRQLERRIDGTRLVSPSFFTRMWAIIGYSILGYLIISTIVRAVMFAATLVF